MIISDATERTSTAEHATQLRNGLREGKGRFEYARSKAPLPETDREVLSRDNEDTLSYYDGEWEEAGPIGVYFLPCLFHFPRISRRALAPSSMNTARSSASVAQSFEPGPRLLR